MRSCLAGLLTLWLLAPVSSAQESSAEYHDTLVELADVIGRAHSIRILCNGHSDQYWRDYMRNMLDLEAPSSSFLRSRMVDTFNAAYTSEQARFGQCTRQAVQEEADLGLKGKNLSERLAKLARTATPIGPEPCIGRKAWRVLSSNEMCGAHRMSRNIPLKKKKHALWKSYWMPGTRL